jgi:TRAP-type mannitol/chloroaromatic compound transport system permease small subunit
MKSLLAISSGIDRVSHSAARVAIWLVLICALVSAFNAISRYALGVSSNAWLELQWYMFAGTVLLGAPHLLAINGHVRVDLLYTRLNDRQRHWLDLAGFAFFLLPFSIFMVMTSWPWFVESWQLQETSSNAGGLLRWPVKLLMPVGFALLIAQGLSEMIKRIAAIKGVIQLDVDYHKPVQ